MPIRRAKALTFRAKGLTDTTDATNAFAGSMQILQDLIPNPSTAQQFVPRPAEVQFANFSGFNAAMQEEALLVIGKRVYGMVATSRYPGKSEPFCYDLVAQAFIPISNVTAANTPTSASPTGDWTPPTMQMIANKIVITHPGYDGVTYFIGWIDLSDFTYAGAATGDTHATKIVDTLSASAYTLGWAVGQTIADSAGDIPAGTSITAISQDGMTVTLSQAATGSNSGVTFTVTGGTKAAPLYGAGQVAGGFPLAAVPTAVSEYNGRAYYTVLNGAELSDSLEPLQCTGAGGTFVPILTMGDDTPTTAMAGVPLLSTVVGGTVQSLIVFKGAESYYQVTGDPSTTDLAVNLVEGSVGTLAPNTLASTPQGIMYAAPDGIRVIGQTGLCSPPMGADGGGVAVPFQYAINPSRMCAAFNQNVYRISVQNGAVNEQPQQEYWHDLNLSAWTGPHSFPAALIQSYPSGSYGSFICAPNRTLLPQPLLNPLTLAPLLNPATGQPLLSPGGFLGGLWLSQVLPNAGSVYVEAGNPIVPVWQPSLLPDNNEMAMNSSPQGALGLSLPPGCDVTILALDESGAQLGLVTVSGGAAGGSTWGSFTWGSSV